MMRFLSLALVLVAVSFAGAASAGEDEDTPRLFQGQGGEEARPELSVRLWLTDGHTEAVSRAINDKFEHDQNLLALVEGEFPLPSQSWISLWGRMGMTVLDKDGEVDGNRDSEASFGLFELNLAVSLAGRGSPLTTDHALPESYVQGYAGLKLFRESFEADAVGGGDSTYETLWFGPQVGLRGYWHLGDTYPEENLMGWGLSAGAALMPWVMVNAKLDSDGGRDADQDSSSGYGYSWFVSTSYRTGSLIFSLGYEAQKFKTDGGDEDVSGGGSGQLWLLESVRRGPFVSLGVQF